VFGLNVLVDNRKDIIVVGKSESFWIRRSILLELRGVRCSVEGVLVFNPYPANVENMVSS